MSDELLAQFKFTEDLARLIPHLNIAGYRVKLGEVLRTEYQAQHNHELGVGVYPSIHQLSLAADLMLFKKGQYLTDNQDYEYAGTVWKSLDPDNRWGGDFHSKDGDHFSRQWGSLA